MINKKTSMGKRLSPAEKKQIKGGALPWYLHECQTSGTCEWDTDCPIFPSGCFSWQPVRAFCLDNYCVIFTRDFW
jgi:hypothetical protein